MSTPSSPALVGPEALAQNSTSAVSSTTRPAPSLYFFIEGFTLAVLLALLFFTLTRRLYRLNTTICLCSILYAILGIVETSRWLSTMHKKKFGAIHDDWPPFYPWTASTAVLTWLVYGVCKYMHSQTGEIPWRLGAKYMQILFTLLYVVLGVGYGIKDVRGWSVLVDALLYPLHLLWLVLWMTRSGVHAEILPSGPDEAVEVPNVSGLKTFVAWMTVAEVLVMAAAAVFSTSAGISLGLLMAVKQWQMIASVFTHGWVFTILIGVQRKVGGVVLR